MNTLHPVSKSFSVLSLTLQRDFETPQHAAVQCTCKCTFACYINHYYINYMYRSLKEVQSYQDDRRKYMDEIEQYKIHCETLEISIKQLEGVMSNKVHVHEATHFICLRCLFFFLSFFLSFNLKSSCIVVIHVPLQQSLLLRHLIIHYLAIHVLYI